MPTSLSACTSAPPVPAAERAEAPRATSRYNIAVVDRAFELVEALARIGPASLARLSTETRCTRTAAFRLLRTLEQRGFVLQDPTRGDWQLGALWGALAHAASRQDALAASARPTMDALAQECREVVFLRTRDGMESTTVALSSPDPAYRLYSQVGERRMLHAGASRLLLAYAPEWLQRQVLRERLPRLTANTRTSTDWIPAELARIRERGWLATFGEVELSAVSVAAPVRDGSGEVTAVLFACGPVLRLRTQRVRALIGPVTEAAARLSIALGAPNGALRAKAVVPFKIEGAPKPRPRRRHPPGGAASSAAPAALPPRGVAPYTGS